MSEEKSYLNETENDNVPKPQRLRKKKVHLLRILILVVVLCCVVFGTIVLPDVLKGQDNTTAGEPEIIVVTVSGKDILLGETGAVSMAELKVYFDTLEEAGDLFAVALINDTENPADYVVYNSIVDLLSEYDIVCEKMPKPASYDEFSASTVDEITSP